MPTKGGLPKPGEVWELTRRLPKPGTREWQTTKHQVLVLERGTGSYWSLKVMDSTGKRHFWVDAAHWHSQGELRYIGPAGPKARERAGIFG